MVTENAYKILKEAIILWKGQESEEIRNMHHVFEVKRGWFNGHKLSKLNSQTWLVLSRFDMPYKMFFLKVPSLKSEALNTNMDLDRFWSKILILMYVVLLVMTCSLQKMLKRYIVDT